MEVMDTALRNESLQRQFVGRNLSDYWRTDRSEDRVLELSSILEGCRAAVGNMGGKFSVNWSSAQHSRQPRSIVLDPSVLNGFKPPFPGRVVDVEIGLALHEVGHELWTKPFPKGTRKDSCSDEQAKLLRRVWNILEDAYVDTNMSREGVVLGEYIRFMRRAFVSDRMTKKTQALLKQPPDRKNIIEAWAGVSLYNIALETEGANTDMVSLMLWLLKETLQYVDVNSNRSRADRVWKVFQRLDQLPEPPEEKHTEITETAPNEGDVNPWLDDGSQYEEPPEDAEKPDKAIGVETDEAPAASNLDPDDQEEDWSDDQEEDWSDDEKAFSGPTGFESETGKDESEDGEESRDGGEADDEDDNRGLYGEPDDDGDDEDADDDEGDESLFGDDEEDDEEDGDTAGGSSTSGDPKHIEEEDDSLTDGASSDDIADQLLENLSSGTDSLSDLTDFMDERQPTEISVDDELAIEDSQTLERKDMGNVLDREVGIGNRTYVAQKAEYDSTAHAKARERNHKEAEAMRQALRKIDEVGARWRYGTLDGKLDTRRLTKATLGKDAIYRRRDLRGKPSTALSLVLDVSGSMSGHYGMVADVATIFSEALYGMDIWYEMAVYTSGGQMTELADERYAYYGGRNWRSAYTSTPGYTIIGGVDQKLSLAKVGMGGGTPSAEALGTAIYRLKSRPEKRKIVIHFTDGGSSEWACRQAVEYGKKVGVDVLTLSVYSDMSHVYGQGRSIVLHSVQELPKATEELLRKIY